MTFDFHNTVAHCDPWFQLEIRKLPADVLDRIAPRTGIVPTPFMRQEMTRRYRSMRQRIMANGVEVDAQESVERVFGEMGLPTDHEAVDRAIDTLMRQSLDALTPVPGAVETIDRLIDAGVPVGIISSAVYHPFLEWALGRFGLLDRLAFVATSASVGYYKSDVRIYHHAYASAGASIELGVHVGDSPKWDIDTAKQAGLAAVLYDEPGAKRTKTASNGLAAPDLVLETLVGAEHALLELLASRRAEAVAR